MSAMASQITSLTIVYSTVYSDTDQRKLQSFTSLAFVRGIHCWPVNAPPSLKASNAENVSTWWRRHGSLPVWSPSQSSNASMPSLARRYSKYMQDSINLHRNSYSQIYRDGICHILPLFKSLWNNYISKVFKSNNNLWTKHIVSICPR